INDYLGKAGIEAQYEEELRGFQGRRYYEVDAQGRHLKELSGAREPLPGQSVQLSLSAELQEFAERLLIENEAIREGRSKKRDPRTGEVLPQKQPWIKGGAIVAMDPKTGELLALASYPRFDPNDFVACSDPYFQSQRRSSVNRWLETEQHLAELWDQRRPMQREATAADGSLYEEELWLTWENFIERILPIENPVRAQLQVQGTVAHALEAQEALDNLQAISQESSVLSLLNHLYTQADGHVAYKGKGLSRKRRFELEQNLEAASRQVAGYKETLDRFVGSLPHNYDKLLLLDLYKLAVDPTRFSEDLASLVGQQSLSSYRESGIAVTRLKEVLRGMMAQLFHESDFKCWRDAEQANFLREKRREERLAETYQKPYLDYLDKEERRQFQAFWATHAPQCIQMLLQGDTEGELSEPYRSHIQAWHQELLAGAHQQLPWVPAFHRLRQQVSGFGVDQLQAYLATVRTYSELDRSLYGWYPQLRREHGVQKEKHLAAAVYPTYGFGYCRSSAYSEGMALGSLFKLVTGYCALLEDYQRLMARGQEVRKLVPFTIVDSLHRGKDKESRWNVGFFNSGKPIPQHYKGGRLIRSASRQLGHVDFVTALERSSNPYFSLLAGDIMEDPEELARMAHAFSFGARTGLDLPNECAGRVPEDIGSNRSGLYAFAIGQHSFVATPLQAAVMLSACGNRGEIYRPLLVKRLSGVIPAQAQAAREIASLQPMLPFKGSPSAILEIEENFAPDLRRELWMPPEVLEPLWLGMYRSAQRTQTRNIYSLYRFYDTHLEGVKDLSALKGQLLGKSSTAEMLESIDLDRLTGRQTYNHLWYGGVIFPEPLSLEGDEHIFWNRQGDPELVVVVFLRFGGYGYEAAPIAAQIARKWREIRAAHL
ncbi:MAG: hypothetical protein KDK78_02935, partial [Chlamydiia bacterium]|nr:hypothetical protein [Chlamydiia bacterium]